MVKMNRSVFNHVGREGGTGITAVRSLTVPLCALSFVALILILLTSISHAKSESTSSVIAADPVIKFNRLTTENGLSNNNIPGITQDDRGFMWFATFDGLNRYDGYDFKVYRNDPDDPNSLSGTQLRRVFKDSSGTIWVGAWGDGLNRYVPETDSFVRYMHDPDNPNSLSHNAVAAIFEDSTGILWIGTRGGGLNRFDPETEQFTHYKHDPKNSNSLGPGFAMNIQEDRNGHLWISNYGSLNRLDPTTGLFIRYQHDPENPKSLGHNSVHATCMDRAGGMWVATTKGLDRFDRETETFIHFRHDPDDPTSLGHNYVTDCMEDSAGNFWVFLYGGGVNLLDRVSGTFTRYPSDSSDPETPSSNNIFHHYQSTSGIIWMATYGGGASYYDPHDKKFVNYRHNPADSTSLSDNTVRPMHVDHNGTLWVGTLNKGLNRLEQETGSFTRFQHERNDPKSLGNNNIRAILEDSKGILWIGTYGGGLDRFDSETETFTHYRNDPADSNSLSDNKLYSLYEDRSGVFWVGTWTKGLEIFDRESGTFTHHPHNPEDPGSISHNGILSFHEDSSDTLWIGTYGGGLNRYDRENRRFMRYKHDTDIPSSLSNNIVFDMHEDRAGAFWIATGRGLNKFDPQTGRFSHYFTKDGLPNDVIYSIIEDRQGHLWLSTNQGISNFDPKNESFRNYDRGDGLQGNQFNSLAYAQGTDDRIYFGGSNGLTAFYPEQIADNPNPPRVVITDLQLANKPVPIGENSILKKSILETEQLTLSYLERIVSFEFSALNFQSPWKNRYKYMLEGFDAKWLETGSTRRFATYTNLDPGKYVFRVIGSNNDGVWNEEGDSIRLTVLPPWWKTWWAYLLYLAILILIVVTLIQFRTRTLQLKGRELEQLVTLRTGELEVAKETAEKAQRQAESANQAKSVFLANMSHELRTPLNAILGFSDMLSRDEQVSSGQQSKLATIKRSGKHLLSMINDVLDLSKIEAGRIDLEPEVFDLLQILKDMERMFLLRAEHDGLDFVVDLDPALARVVKGDVGKLRQILINLLGNAVKFTKEGVVTLRAKTLPIAGESPMVILQIEVEDNGVGIDPDQLKNIFKPFVQAGHSPTNVKGTGLGLAITKSFIDLLSGEIRVKSTLGEGSLFQVEIPMSLAEASEVSRTAVQSKRVVGLAAGQPAWRILVVEDDQDNRLLLTSLLDQVGYDVREAENGEEAVKLFAEWHPHFVWMDMRMPVMDGYEAAAKIRTLPGSDEVKIVALTASVFREQYKRIMAAGCDDVKHKPYQESEIFDTIAQQLGVRYQYEEEVGDMRTEPNLVLTADMLHRLPAELLDDLTSAARQLNINMMTEVVNKVRLKDPVIAEAIEALIEGFQFSRILKLIDQQSESDL
ncbi:MAG: two-component regulator propeller domain-containing protein [Candidatus Sedimenticola sp. 20ELBAFRAG]